MEKFWLTWFLILLSISRVNCQIVAQDSTSVSSTNGLDFLISGGNQPGSNLFHSFAQFSVPTDGSATFFTMPEVEAVFSRITGSSISKIEGTIGLTGSSADLFLLNPNGIVFGSDASLNLPGSFLATTADRFLFADGNFFSATEESPLSIARPVGFLFGNSPGEVVSRSISLQVGSGETLALMGGNLTIEGMFLAPGGFLSLFLPGGNIELGSVAGGSQVSLDSDLMPGYGEVNGFGDIRLNSATLNTSGAGSGRIRLQGRNIEINDSQISGLNFGASSGGSIAVNAQFLELKNSSINMIALSTGAAGDISIATNRLVLSGESLIDATTADFGNGGNITIKASELIEIGELSRLTAQTFGVGDAGNIDISTGLLSLRDGGQILSSTRRRSGDGGEIQIRADEILLSGIGLREPNPNFPFLETIVPSGILAVSESISVGEVATGDSGTIEIETNQLTIEDGALISVRNSAGRGGNIGLDVRDLLVLRGSEIAAAAREDGGNIEIDAGLVVALPEVNQINADAGLGSGGNIEIRTNAIFGSQFVEISASSQVGLDGQVGLSEELNLNEQFASVPRPVPLPMPHQGCPAPGGEGSFRNEGGMLQAIPEAQSLIARSDGTIDLLHDPSVELLQLARRYEDQGRLKEAKVVYESMISSGKATPETYERLVNLLFKLEPSQENLQAILETHGESRLTELEDFLNCGEISLTSVYAPDLENKPDAIVTMIELEDTLKIIVSTPGNDKYEHEFAASLSMSEVIVPLTILGSALQADNVSEAPFEDFILKPSQALYETIFSELKTFLPPNGTLLFLLDGEFQKVSVALLQNESGRYLIEDYSIAQTTIPYIYQSNQQKSNNALVAGISDKAPSYSQIGDLQELPYIEVELSLFNTLPINHSILKNEAFTVENLLELGNRYSILHIASYGQFSSLPTKTFLAAHDRLITIEDFHKLVDREGDNSPIPLELMVLSACETAKGDKDANLGLAGIAVRAGAESTIASMWRVGDLATSQWMEVFYQSWLIEGKTKVEAVRDAQLAILEKYNNPLVFAPFILVGNWL